jgi:peptide/nickel transport system substrate-binding protein
MLITRRDLMKHGAAGAALVSATGLPFRAFAQGEELTIAYNVNLPSFDPTVGPSAVNPTIQGIYQSVFDQYIAQAPNLDLVPGLLTEWGWNEDRSKIQMTVREGATWHDGSPVTPEDVAWSLERAGNPDTGNPIQFVWGKIGNFAIDGNVVSADVKEFEPTLFKWMGFLTGYVLPKAYYESVGPEGFEAAPVGSGPYKVEAFERNAFIRLAAHDAYWGGAPAYKSVVIKFVPDAASRVAEVESGQSQVVFDIPYEEFDRLKEQAGLKGVTTPVSDIAMIFLNDVEPMTDPNVRKAAAHAIDKQLLIDRLLSGYGVKIDTLQTPEYDAYDSSISVAHDPALATELLAASGYSLENPVRFTIQTTRGFKPKDYEMIQAIVGMWREVGIEAEIEVYEIAKHYELRAGGVLQLGQLDRRPVHIHRLCDVRPLPSLGLGRPGHARYDRPALGRGRRGEAHRGLQGGRPAHRRERRGDPASSICAANRLRRHGGRDAARLRRRSALSDEAGRVSTLRLDLDRGPPARPHHLVSSLPGLTRQSIPSRSPLTQRYGMDARIKSGHDGTKVATRLR